MERDMDLVRKLLLLAEQDGKSDELCKEYGDKQVAGHIAIMIDAGLIKGAVANGQTGKPIAAEIIRLTWAGHEFLDNARNDTIWKKVKKKISDKSMSVSFDIIASLLKSIVRKTVDI